MLEGRSHFCQVDVIEGSRIYMPAIYVINKIDQITLEELNVISKLPHYSPVCAYLEWNLDGLVDMIWEYLDLIRIYTKPKASLNIPSNKQFLFKSTHVAILSKFIFVITWFPLDKSSRGC